MIARLLRTSAFRLALLYVVIFTMSVTVLFTAVYWITNRALQQQLATVIEDDARDLGDVYVDGGLAAVELAIGHRLDSGLHQSSGYLLLNPEGRKLAGNLPTDAAVRGGWQQLLVSHRHRGPAQEKPVVRSERSLLALGVEFGDGSLLVVGEDPHGIVAVEEAIAQAFVWGGAATVLLAALGGVLISVTSLRRIDAIGRTTRAIIDGDLSRRVPSHGTDDELDRLALSINEMLDRLESLMDSLHQVSNDIAHDLRTPLTRLRQRLERARLSARDMQDYDLAVDQAIADSDTILDTFAALLRIAQIEAGTRRAGFTEVDLSVLVSDIEAVYQPIAEDRGQRLSTEIEAGVTLRGDRALLVQMLANLVENAICHTPCDTDIGIALKRHGVGVTMTVADDGPGIPAEAHDKVFRRLYRLERSRSTPGSGLGLSLVAAVADLHGARIDLADNGPGLQVTLAFSGVSMVGPASQAGE